MLKKYFKWNIEVFFDVIIILFCIIAIIPAFQLAQYNIYGASDDFFHGFFLRDKPYWEAVKYWYNSGYNGRFANSLIMQIPGRPFLTPGFSRLFPIISFILLFLSQTIFLRSVSKSFSWSRTLMFSTLLFTFFIAHNPHIRQFYWFSGFSVYVMPAIFYFLSLYIFINRLNKRYNALAIAGIVLTLFFIIGSNENWMIVMMLTILSFIILEIKQRKKLRPTSYFILAYAIGLSLMVVLAPGTTSRLESEVVANPNQNIAASLSTSLFHLSDYLKDWFWVSMLIPLSFLLYLLPKRNTANHTQLFGLPTWYIAFSAILLVFAGCFVLLFSLGTHIPIRERGLIPVFYASALLVILLVVKLASSPLLDKLRNTISTKAVYVLIFILTIFGVSNSINLKNIHHDLISGNAKKLSQQTYFVYDFIEQSESDTIHIPDITVKSNIIYPIRIPNKSKGLNHWILSTYFKKRVITRDNSQTLEAMMEKAEKANKSDKTK
ncbi:MAG: DUF6056 family protein [Bacteroidales bacterium]